MTRRKLTALIGGIAVLVVGIIVVAVILAIPSSPHASKAPTTPSAAQRWAKEFTPGYIISDQTMFDSTTMTAGQVQAFFDSQRCTPRGGAVCLSRYQQSTPAIAQDRNCNAAPALTNALASQILVAVARACTVNPEVLIVLLQKEQSLLTAPSPYGYERATGYACPDTKPCDSQYFGFFNQVYKAARQFHEYTDTSVKWNFHPGPATVAYSPNASCGSAEIYLKNQATADLYNYTPYQPNPATIANPSLNNRCSTHGNLNFFIFFSEWFGDPRVIPGSA